MSAVSQDVSLFNQSANRKVDADNDIKLSDEMFCLKTLEKIREKLGTLDCQICLEEGSIIKLQTIPCGHSCCSDCIEKMNKLECHICRTGFIKGQVKPSFQINGFTLVDEIRIISEQLEKMKIVENDSARKNVELTKRYQSLIEKFKQIQMSETNLAKANVELTKKCLALEKNPKLTKKLTQTQAALQKVTEENIRLKSELAKMTSQAAQAKPLQEKPEKKALKLKKLHNSGAHPSLLSTEHKLSGEKQGILTHQFNLAAIAAPATKPAARPAAEPEHLYEYEVSDLDEDQGSYEDPDLYEDQDLDQPHNKKINSKSKKAWGGKF